MPLTQNMKLALGAGGALLLWTVLSLLRSGSQGYAWGFWSVIFSILWTMLSWVFSSRHHHHGWGSHSSGGSWGSRGGGGSSSGGGGASGSW
jgi:hypothetical protein